mmetsp:Transcript_73057/g.116529  ORF Transcript_73057/g.116529 Transcript_73057/m.116529 type:complete len:93 (+) Transcript_73057:788-1066(+)
MAMPTRSGLQQQVLRLYGSFLRQCRIKVKDPNCTLTKEDLPMVQRNIRVQFEKHRDVSKKDFMRIEYLIRSGEKQLKMFKSPTVTGITTAGT